jgi:hypothetical protein
MSLLPIASEAQAQQLRNEAATLGSTIQRLESEITANRQVLAQVGSNPQTAAVISAQIAQKQNQINASTTRRNLILASLAAAASTPNNGLIPITSAAQILQLREEVVSIDAQIPPLRDEIARAKQQQTALSSINPTVAAQQGALAAVKQSELDALTARKNLILVSLTRAGFGGTIGSSSVVTLPGDPSLPGRATRPSGERPRQNDPHTVVRAATCTEPEQRVYFNENGGCYQPLTNLVEDEVCPIGWSLANVITGEFGCAQVGALSGKVPLCERKITRKELGRQQQFECCTKNVSGDVNCPIDMCRPGVGKNANAACIDAFKEQCVDSAPNGIGLNNEGCKQFALDNFADATVDNAVRAYCRFDGDSVPSLRGQPIGRRDPFCACVNAGELSLCAPDDKNCFAALFPGLESQAICMAPQCTQRREGVFVPRKEGGCGPICLSQINAVQQSKISVGGSLNLVTFCGDELTEEQIAATLQKTGMTRDEFNLMRAAYKRGDLSEVDRINKQVQARLGIVPGSENLPDNVPEQSSSGLSQGAIIALATIGALLLLGALAGLVYYLVKMQNNKQVLAANNEKVLTSAAQRNLRRRQAPGGSSAF